MTLTDTTLYTFSCRCFCLSVFTVTTTAVLFMNLCQRQAVIQSAIVFELYGSSSVQISAFHQPTHDATERVVVVVPVASTHAVNHCDPQLNFIRSSPLLPPKNNRTETSSAEASAERHSSSSSLDNFVLSFFLAQFFHHKSAAVIRSSVAKQQQQTQPAKIA